PGYAEVERSWQVGDVVELRLPMAARWTYPHARIDAVRGQVAVERGPVVYCLESTDPDRSVDEARVVVDTAPVSRGDEVLVRVVTEQTDDPTWPYGSEAPAAVSFGASRLVPLTPYYGWARR